MSDEGSFEEQNFVNMVVFHKSKLKKIQTGVSAGKLFTVDERRKLRHYGILTYRARSRWKKLVVGIRNFPILTIDQVSIRDTIVPPKKEPWKPPSHDRGGRGVIHLNVKKPPPHERSRKTPPIRPRSYQKGH
jgi:hypothetical protein